MSSLTFSITEHIINVFFSVDTPRHAWRRWFELRKLRVQGWWWLRNSQCIKFYTILNAPLATFFFVKITHRSQILIEKSRGNFQLSKAVKVGKNDEGNKSKIYFASRKFCSISQFSTYACTLIFMSIDVRAEIIKFYELSHGKGKNEEIIF